MTSVPTVPLDPLHETQAEIREVFREVFKEYTATVLQRLGMNAAIPLGEAAMDVRPVVQNAEKRISSSLAEMERRLRSRP